MKQLCFFAFGLLFLLCGCTRTKERAHSMQGEAFGTTYSIVYFAPEPVIYLERELDSVFLAINKSVSTYLPNSDISKINQGDSTIVVDQIFKYNYVLSQEIYQQTKGYFDPTVGVLRNAYGFGDTAPLKQLDEATIDSLLQMVGFDKVRLTAENKIIKEHPGIYFDFNAVAKGYAVDATAAHLTNNQIDNFLVEIGGEIVARGINLDKAQPWKVGIEAVDSFLDARVVQVAVNLNDRAMASSGNYRKFRIDSLTGQKYVHTINPLTGSAEKSDVTSATVFAQNCALADAFATSFMAMGIEKSKKLLTEVSNIDVYLTYLDSLGNSQVYISENLKADLIPD